MLDFRANETFRRRPRLLPGIAFMTSMTISLPRQT
jgi:hypothetical protein